MAKYHIETEKALSILKTAVKFEPSDIIVHKKMTFAEITGAFKNQFTDVELLPVSPGTEVYLINGTNTSVIKSIGEPK